jgi:uncharacterized protein (DUF924 family)
MTTPDEVLGFWREIGPKGWYQGGAEIDNACRRFTDAWRAAHQGAFRDWLGRPEPSLAYLILTDQIPRNINRGTAEAFATDALALSGTSVALASGHDRRIDGDIRQFFYLPYEHAESRQAQARCVSLFVTRMPEARDNLLHARVHREIIRRFGRFPYRNEALGRVTSPAEQEFLDGEGYAGVLKSLSA